MSLSNSSSSSRKHAVFQQKLTQALQIAEMEAITVFSPLIKRHKSKKVRFVETRFYCYIPIEGTQRHKPKRRECKHNTEDCTHYWKRKVTKIAPDWRDHYSLEDVQFIEKRLIKSSYEINIKIAENHNPKMLSEAREFANMFARISRKHTGFEKRRHFERIMDYI